MIEILFILAPLVIVPLGLRLIRPLCAPSVFLRAAILVQPFAAIPAVASFLIEKGTVGGLLALPWLGVTGLLALAGLMNLKDPGRWDASRLLVTAAMFLIPVGGVHLVASRMGIALLGFPEPIILLTAVHFHYTAFAAPILAALAVPRGGLAAKLGGFGIVLATPMLAAGFVYEPALKLVAAMLLVVCVSILAFAQLAPVRTLRRPASRVLLILSAVSVLAGMALAAVYELGFFTGRAWISIPRMAQTHGLLNGVGFSLCGLLAWWIELKADR